jgi:hypothetical protein
MIRHFGIERHCPTGLLLCLTTGGLILVASAGSVHAKASKASVPPLSVQVDPRVELMSTIFRLAGNPEYGQGRVNAYADDVEKQFGTFRDHAVVKMAKSLRSSHGVSYDAPMSMAVHWSDAYQIGEKVPFSPRPTNLDGRWTIEGSREFLAAARQFVQDTAFKEFSDKHRLLYELAESRFRALVEQKAHLEWFGEFFGERPGATFVAVPALLNGPNNYGVRCRSVDGKEELYCILGVWHTDKEGMPDFQNYMVQTVIHEFCHSYANPIIDRHMTELKVAGEKMFPHVARKMRSQAYGNWETMFYESLVRACVLRHARRYDGETASSRGLQQQRALGFAWIEELAKLLGEYESHRDQYHSLDAFSPRLIAFFNDYAEKSVGETTMFDRLGTFFDELTEKLVSQQSIPSARRPKVVSMVPANGATDVDPNLTTIRVTFDRPMTNGCWSICTEGSGEFPKVVGEPSYDTKQTTWTVHVKLKPDCEYQFMLNSGEYTAFQSEDGISLEPVKVKFKTAKEGVHGDGRTPR